MEYSNDIPPLGHIFNQFLERHKYVKLLRSKWYRDRDSARGSKIWFLLDQVEFVQVDRLVSFRVAIILFQVVCNFSFSFYIICQKNFKIFLYRC